MQNYDPFNPQIRKFFIASPHEKAVQQFTYWLQQTEPDAYAQLAAKRPDLIDPVAVINSGALQVSPAKLNGLADGTDANATTAPATSWGTDVLDFLKQALPTYYQAKAQQSIIDVNVQRAEQGLPPLDSSALAPQVNVGVSNGVQQLGYLAIGGLVIVGLLSAYKGRK